jgi:hypothetical protein
MLCERLRGQVSTINEIGDPLMSHNLPRLVYLRVFGRVSKKFQTESHTETREEVK